MTKEAGRNELSYPIPDSSGAEMMEFLMEEHELGLADLPEIVTAEIIAAIISDEQDLTIKQLKSLSKRFQVSPAIFI